MNIVEANLAPVFLGTVFNILLYGIVIMQTYLYYISYKRDPRWMRLYVALIFLLETINTIFGIGYLYIELLVNAGNPLKIARTTGWGMGEPATTSIIAPLVQMFFAWRVMVLTSSWIMTSLIVLTSLASCVGGLVVTGLAAQSVFIFAELPHLQIPGIIWLTDAAICDILIAATLVYRLRSEEVYFVRTEDVVSKAIRVICATGAITALWAILNLITFFATPSPWQLMFNYTLAKMYSNALLCSLNSRRGGLFNHGRAEPDAPLPSIRFDHQTTGVRSARSQQYTDPMVVSVSQSNSTEEDPRWSSKPIELRPPEGHEPDGMVKSA